MPLSRIPRVVLAGLAIALGLAGVPAVATPAVGAANGMVVSAHRLASEVGVEVLRNGGNAVDAAVAVGYALAVVHPVAGNLGGGGFMTIRLAGGGSTFVDFRETAPAAATEDMYLDGQGTPVPQASTLGHRAAGVPGSVAGLEHARERYGTRDARTLVAPALALAAEGFVLEAGDVAPIDAAAAELARDPDAARIFLPDGKLPQAGTRLVQGDLGRTLEAIASDGAAGFYLGPVAAEIARASQAAGGILTADDLASYRVRERTPVTCDYRGFTLISAPPPSSGGVTLCLLLNLVEDFPLATLGRDSADYVHLLAEAMRLAFVERNTRLGDPDYVTNPVAQLLSDAYAARLRARIDPSRVTPSPALLAPNGSAESPQTTHYSVVDGAGNAVSVTATLNGAFGAKVVAGSTGVLLNNEMDDFTVKPGVPNLFGLVQGRANAIAPGKRPLSSMTPTVVTRDGALVLVIGSPGGPRIITTVLQVILNVFDHGMTVDEAIAATRLHHQWLPDALFIEPGRVSGTALGELQARGHEVREGRPWGQAAGILVGGASLASPATDGLRYFGAADPRGGLGAAIGY